MLYASLASFLIGAIIGIIQLVQWMNHKRPSRALPISHGVFNVLGFVLLITFAVTSDGVIPTASIILFCIAMAGYICGSMGYGYQKFITDHVADEDTWAVPEIQPE